MTLRAVDGAVSTAQWKGREIVIETLVAETRDLPAGDCAVMALLAAH